MKNNEFKAWLKAKTIEEGIYSHPWNRGAYVPSSKSLPEKITGGIRHIFHGPDPVEVLRERGDMRLIRRFNSEMLAATGKWEDYNLKEAPPDVWRKAREIAQRLLDTEPNRGNQPDMFDNSGMVINPDGK